LPLHQISPRPGIDDRRRRPSCARGVRRSGWVTEAVDVPEFVEPVISKTDWPLPGGVGDFADRVGGPTGSSGSRGILVPAEEQVPRSTLPTCVGGGFASRAGSGSSFFGGFGGWVVLVVEGLGRPRWWSGRRGTAAGSRGPGGALDRVRRAVVGAAGGWPGGGSLDAGRAPRFRRRIPGLRGSGPEALDASSRRRR